MENIKPKVEIVDTTLRDGEQAPGVAFPLDQKVAIARLLDQAGVYEIEAGTPAINGEETEAIAAILGENLNALVSVWTRAVEADINQVSQLGVRYVFVSVPVSDLQIESKLRKNRAQVLDFYPKLITSAVQAGLDVRCGFEDASRADRIFLRQISEKCIESGASRVRLADTVGILRPKAASELVQSLSNLQIPLEIHTHNDFGLAVVNSLEAAVAGARFIDTTVNGIGERAGNAGFEQVVMAAKHLYGLETGINTGTLKELSSVVSEFSGIPISPLAPVVGANAFRHESGIHIDGILKNQKNYEPYSPEEIGSRHEFHIGKHTGKGAERKLHERSGLE